MANDVKIVISTVTRGVGAGFKKITRGIKLMGAAAARAARLVRGIGSAFKKVARRVSVAGLALIGVAALTVKAYMTQQDAEQQLAAALSVHGDAVDDLIPKYKAFASAIQEQTKYGDEALLSQMAYLRNLGVSTDKLEEATRAAVGLAATYKLDLKTAMMLVGRASQGQTQMLTRYGIALDDTMTKEQKFDALLKIGGANFALAEKDAKTLTGRLTQMKNAFGDTLEVIGEQIATGLKLDKVFNKLKESFENLSRRLKADKAIEKWAEGAKVALESLSGLVGAIFGDPAERKQALSDIASLLKAGMMDAGNSFINLLSKYMPKIGALAGSAFMSMIKTPFETMGDRSAAKGVAIERSRARNKERGFRWSDLDITDRSEFKAEFEKQLQIVQKANRDKAASPLSGEIDILGTDSFKKTAKLIGKKYTNKSGLTEDASSGQQLERGFYKAGESLSSVRAESARKVISEYHNRPLSPISKTTSKVSLGDLLTKMQGGLLGSRGELGSKTNPMYTVELSKSGVE